MSLPQVASMDSIASMESIAQTMPVASALQMPSIFAVPDTTMSHGQGHQDMENKHIADQRVKPEKNVPRIGEEAKRS